MHKVLAYITRENQGRRELLVFTHRDYPEAGIQVPAGTIEPREAPEVAVLREAEEETGFGCFLLVRELGVFEYHPPEGGEAHTRHVYHLRPSAPLPDRWEWTETDGGKVPDAEGYVFQYAWVDLADPPDLAGGQGDYLHLLPG